MSPPLKFVLLIFTTFGCTQITRSAETEAVKKIKQSGGRIYFDDNKKVNSIIFARDHVYDKDLIPLKHFKHLKALTLRAVVSEIYITDNSIATFKELPSLKTLILKNTRISPKAISELKKFKPDLHIEYTNE